MSPNEETPEPIESEVAEVRPSSRVKKEGWLRKSLNPFRIATLRGLGIVLPPLLTIIFFFWAWNTIERAALKPLEASLRFTIAWSIQDIREDSDVQSAIRENPNQTIVTPDDIVLFKSKDGVLFRRVGGQWIPETVHTFVDSKNPDPAPRTAAEYYQQFAGYRYLKRPLLIPAFLAAFIALLYLCGKLMAAGVGRIFWRAFESLINRVPIISNVYSSVKQVTDFAFAENEIQFNRVVALEYPRKGIWSMGFVTGESMLDIKNAAGEPMLSVLMPTSPMPATGFTISIPKSETIDLDISIDQAIQFCVSCGVVVPEHQQPKSTFDAEVRRRFKQHIETPSTKLPPPREDSNPDE